MNDHEATIEARRRWGSRGFARNLSPTQRMVGSGVGDETYGEGPTWEDAFLNASQRSRGVSSAGASSGDRTTAPTDTGHTESLLGLAIAYVEAYIGRFPDNVRPEHVKEFRDWRAAHSAHDIIVIHESRDE